MGVGRGALDIRCCANLRRFVYDHTHIPINFTAVLSMDPQFIRPELVCKLKLREENILVREIQTLNPIP